MTLCTNCGTPNTDGAPYCANCGSKMPVTGGSQPEPRPVNPSELAPGLSEYAVGGVVEVTLTAGRKLGLKLEDIGGAVEVAALAPGGQAKAAGLEVGDRIVKVGKAFNVTAGFRAAAVFEHILGDKRPLTLQVIHAHEEAVVVDEHDAESLRRQLRDAKAEKDSKRCKSLETRIEQAEWKAKAAKVALEKAPVAASTGGARYLPHPPGGSQPGPRPMDPRELAPGLSDVVEVTLVAGRKLGLKLEDIGGAVEVTALAPDGQAKALGMEVGDRIVKVGKAFNVTAGFRAAAVFEHILGDKRPLTLQVIHASKKAVVEEGRTHAALAEPQAAAVAVGGGTAPALATAADDVNSLRRQLQEAKAQRDIKQCKSLKKRIEEAEAKAKAVLKKTEAAASVEEKAPPLRAALLRMLEDALADDRFDEAEELEQRIAAFDADPAVVAADETAAAAPASDAQTALCTNCGTPNTDGAPYCANCGSKMPVTGGSQPEPRPVNPSELAPGLSEYTVGGVVEVTLTAGRKLGLKLVDTAGAVEVVALALDGQAKALGMEVGDRIVKVGKAFNVTAGKSAAEVFEHILGDKRPLTLQVIHKEVPMLMGTANPTKSDDVTVAINPMDPSEGSSEERGPSSWKEKIQQLRKGEVTKKVIYLTVALALVTTLCSSVGAAIVAEGVLTSKDAFVCCTTSTPACNYAKRPLLDEYTGLTLTGIKIDPKLVSNSSSGICIGPDANGKQKGDPGYKGECDGTQAIEGTCKPTDLDTMLRQANGSAVHYVYLKLALIAWAFYLFTYTISNKGAEWHANDEELCPNWFRYLTGGLYLCLWNYCNRKEADEMDDIADFMSQQELCYIRSCCCVEICCCEKCTVKCCGEEKRKTRLLRIKAGCMRAFYDRKCWHYFLYASGFFLTFAMATLTSGFLNPKFPSSNTYDGGSMTVPTPAPVEHPVYLTVYPEAGSWQGPLIVTIIGSFLGLPFIGPAQVMQDRVSAHWKRLKEVEGSGRRFSQTPFLPPPAIEMQAMDRM
jgi:C-terminal processing protease CtpA/Prc